MVDVVISIAAKVAELMVVPVGKHICYPFQYSSNMDALKKQVEKLKGVREMLQHTVDEAKTQGDEIEKVVENWLTKVDEFTKGVVKPIIDDEGKAGKLCSIGFCPNLMARYSLSKKAAKTAKEVIDLWGEGKFDKVSYRPLLRKTISTYIRDDYEDFDSRKPIFQEIMQALKDDNSKMIGVYGMGGVGKTTLVKRVVAQAIEDKLFDFETIVDITETPDIKKIQQQIADDLGLKFHEESLSTRSVRLRDRLKKEKKVLIVLDNIWEKLDLEAVGIPFGHEEEKGSSSLQEEDPKGRNDDKRRCKILLTSRSEYVSRNDMNAEKNFLVENLSEEEAGHLFWKIVGDAAKNCDFETIGVEIIQYCAGLPVVIATVASALKTKSLFDWKDALDQLRRSNPRHIKGMDALVYSAIKLSYDFLESEEAKSLFLLRSLQNASSDSSIDYLLRYCMGLGLFQNVSTLEQGRNRLYKLINHLKASCLLLDGNTNESVKMHDIIHAVAVSIASTDKLMFNIQDVSNLKEMLEEKLPKDSTAISLCYKDVSMLPERLVYPKLKLFFLFMEEFSLQIPDTFFERMEELKVLDMTKIHMLSLPSSLSKLTNLQTLCLDGCQLRNVAIIGELKRLEILCFFGSDIEELPEQIGQLTRLRLLELSNCSNLKVISPNVISSLTRLEELYMGNSFIWWEVEGQSNASLSELKQLFQLTTLEIHVPDAQIMPQDLMIFEKLERCKIVIGDVWEWSHVDKASRAFKLKLNNNIYLRNGIKSLLSRTEDLYLDELKGVKNVIYQLNGEGFPQLKHLHVQNGSEIQYIVNSIGWGQCNVFPMLQSLFLHNLINLEKICHGQLATESFNKLKILKIGRCDGLKHLFSISIARNLLQLQEIEVTNCKKLKEIVFNESHEQFQQNDSVSKIEFTQLRILSLRCLPLLTSFGLKESTPFVGSEEIFAENFVPSFSQNVWLPCLENLKLSSINIECMWLDQLPAISSFCQTLTSLTVEECSGDLKFLFSYSMVRSLVQLETLEIRNCKSIEGIINTEELREEGKMIKMVFAKLIKLQLKGLPNLTQFGSGNSVEFHSLTQLSIEDCPKLETFSSALTSEDIKQSNEIGQMNCQYNIHPLFDETVVLPTLGSMNLSSIRIQTIWHNQLQPMSSSFQNLTEIVMDGCDTLKYVYSSSVVESLIQLKHLEISNCKFMEAVIITQGERTSNTLFPKLYRLHLKHLPKLTSFCNFEGKSIELPSLTHLLLKNCPKMQAFVSNSPDADIPTNKEEQVNSEQSQHANIQPLFDEKVRIPDLKILRIKQMNMKKIWHHDHLISDSFSKIDSFRLYDCHNLLNIFPSNMLGRLQKLEELFLTRCNSLEKIFEELKISSCMMEEIVAKEDLEAVPRFVFHQLKWLELVDLPRLRSFNSGVYILEWPKLKKLRMWGCNKVEILTSGFLSLQKSHGKSQLENSIQEPLFIVDKVAFPEVEELTLEWDLIVKEILHGKFSEYSCNLKVLQCLSASKQSAICPCCFLYTLPNLHRLEVYYGFGEEIFICEGLDCKVKHIEAPSKLNYLTLIGTKDSSLVWEENSLPSKIFRNLTTLKVSNCNNLKTLVSSFVSFQNLSTLEVSNCNGLVNLLAVPVAKSLVQLTRLKITECKMIEKIVTQGRVDETEDMIIFNQLKYLELKCLPRLTSFCSENYEVEFPTLQQVVVEQCQSMRIFSQGALSTPRLHKLQITEAKEEGNWEGDLNSTIQKMFKDMVGFRGTEKLTLSEFPHLKEVWHSQFPISFFSGLKSLVVGDDCSSLRYIFTPSVALGLMQLQELEIKNCAVLEAIIVIEEEWTDNTLFPNLTRLELKDLPKLLRFYNFSGNSIELPSTDADITENKENLHTDIQPFFDEKVALSSLAWLNLSSIGIKTIWHNQLQSMSLSFQNITNIIIDDCDTLKYVFSSSIESLIQLEVLEISNCKFMEVIILTQGERTSNILLPKLIRLHLKHLPKLTSFCNFEGKSIELPSLTHLWLENCPKLHAFVANSPDADIPTNKEEQVNSEQSLHANIQPLFDEKVQIPYLKSLQIKKMNMRKIWYHYRLTLDSFSKIDSFRVYDCHNLFNIFPSNMLGRLQKLEKLVIVRCNSVEEIFEELKISSCVMEEFVAKEDLEAVPRFVFPQLKWLELVDLPSLRSFYSGVYISEWPKLKDLWIWECNKVEILTSEFLSRQKSHGESQLQNSIQEPLFIVDKVAFPEVEQLTLQWDLIVKEILHGKFSEYSCNLKVLWCLSANKQSAICPCCFLYTLPNLERLAVYYGFGEEIFICEGPDCKVKHVEAPSKLNYLSLAELKDSSLVWEENSVLSKIFRNSTTLEVSKCNNLKTLVPSFVSFQNLSTLEVSNCNGLVNLFAVSVAKSLVQLSRLKITGCKMIETIVTHGRVDEIEDMIIFNQLKYLEFHCLPRLTSFCSENYVVKFPSLQLVVVEQCQSMKIFSHGALSTPRLHKVQITEADEEGNWEGDLNTTTQKMFKDMIGFSGIENFTVSDLPHLKEVWHSQLLVGYFSNLKSLVVDDRCSSLKHMFTPSLALGLVQLQELEIKNCTVLEAIIVIEEERTDNTLFPNLTRLELKDLPKLLRFCNFSGNSIELPSLARLLIDNCPNMETFISGSTEADMPASKENLHTDIQPFFDEKIRLPNLKVLILDKMDRLRKIWHHQLISDSFCNLESLEVYNCHNVLIVFPSNMLGRLQKLDKLWLRNCSSLDKIIELQASICGKTQAITATQLRKLELRNLPKLKHIWNMDSQGLLSFPNLLSIRVLGCDTLKSIFPASVGRNLLRLDELWIEKCCMVEEIFAKEEEVNEVVPRFPRLTFLKLVNVSRLQSFYPMVHISKWPMLKELQIWNCDKVEISASKFLSFQVNDGESQHEMPMGQPLLLLDKVPLTNLECLGLDWKWIEKEALHEKLQEYSCKLKILKINGFRKGTDICVFCFPNKLPNLEKLQVSGCFFKEVFLSEGLGCEEEHVETPSKLSKLRLFDVYDSLLPWEENSLCSKVFQNLANLEVDSCNNLRSLVPSHVSFQNLTMLVVFKCNELLNLVAVSTAKSLVQLTKLWILECKMIEEIIIHEGDEMEDWIIFKKLRCVALKCLPSLTSFSSGNYTIEFPSLQQVVVRECPKMQIFSRGILNTPRLHTLQTTEAEGYGFWEGDLNTTIEHLFIENGQSSKEN